MPHAYSTVEQLAETVEIPAKKLTPAKHDELLRILAGVSQRLDRWCERSFTTYDAVQYFTPKFRDYLTLPDILSITEVALDWRMNGTYSVVLDAAKDYYVEPLNAPVEERPYTRMKLRADSRYSFLVYEKAIRITGKWGFWEAVLPTDAVLTQAIGAADRVLEVSNADAIKVGYTIKLGAEQMFVVNKDAEQSRIWVRRAQQSTTAAAHVVDTPISFYEYPEALQVATILQAARIYRRAETPLGIVNNPGDIGWRAVYIPKADTDVQALVSVFRKRYAL